MANRDLINPGTRDLQDVEVGTENRYPYTYPFTYAVEGLRLFDDPDKRAQSSSTTGFRDVVTFTGRDLQSV